MEEAERQACDVDAALAERAKAGDAHAFARLAAAVRPRMYRWALVQLLDGDAAEDVTQRALIRLRRALPSFRGDAAFGTWLYTIVRSASADWRRSESRRRESEARAARLVEPDASAPDPLHAGRFEALVGVVRENLRHLPGRQRAVFDLVDLQGFTPREAATLLGLNDATTRVHLLRARRNIRARLIAANPTMPEAQ